MGRKSKVRSVEQVDSAAKAKNTASHRQSLPIIPAETYAKVKQETSDLLERLRQDMEQQAFASAGLPSSALFSQPCVPTAVSHFEQLGLAAPSYIVHEFTISVDYECEPSRVICRKPEFDWNW